MNHLELVKKRRGESYVPPGTLLCLDPGFTTGVAVFRNGILAPGIQVETIVSINGKNDIKWDNLLNLFKEVRPTRVVCENYRIYAHKLDQHTNSSVDTLRLIGGIDMLCKLSPIILGTNEPIPIRYQMASEAKGFCTDDKLKRWGMWQKGMRHSRDAVRHGCYYLLFNKEG